MIELTLDRGSGVPPYRQIVEQVRGAMKVGRLVAGDQLPTADMVVAQLGLNRNTVSKAYHELSLAGLVTVRPGRGTFVARTLEAAPEPDDRVWRALEQWIAAAHRAGLDDDGIRWLVSRSLSRP